MTNHRVRIGRTSIASTPILAVDILWLAMQVWLSGEVMSFPGSLPRFCIMQLVVDGFLDFGRDKPCGGTQSPG